MGRMGLPVPPGFTISTNVCELFYKSKKKLSTKIINQICIAGTIQGLSESIFFMKHTELNPEDVLDVISSGGAQSWQMNNRFKTMVKGEFDFGFAVDLMRKDLDIAFSAADEYGINLEVTKLVDQFYEDVQNLGGNKLDTSSLIKRLIQKV